MTAKTVLGAAGGAAVVALVTLGATWIVDSDTTTAPASRDNPAASLRTCVARWNGPANSRQRAVLNTAARGGPSAPAEQPGGVPLERRASCATPALRSMRSVSARPA